ncbi:BMC domain-containing protein [Halanaerobium praevalens]|uniref:Microcompartments protein n=1 Tax=Halanaerobium praevalens (strain ATCC 33744 / DSM 2228 / GSL) TaxID=572479 RepID=E3DN22_HALPG|nr:BMC domain-containing protein [Halanaerobium praevalens]ADO76428.1 microcompartments protein [Halanaerobium praevalens DSM 2228]
MNNNSLALIEFSKIAVGIETADQILKTAAVEIVHSKFICPGKYSVLFAGSVSAVETALNSGLEIAKNKKALVNHFLLANINQQVKELLLKKRKKKDITDSLGILEYINISSTIQAADIAVKAAEVELLELKLAMAIGGKGFVIFSGENEACKQAIKAVESALGNKHLISKALISSPEPKLIAKILT